MNKVDAEFKQYWGKDKLPIGIARFVVRTIVKRYGLILGATSLLVIGHILFK